MWFVFDFLVIKGSLAGRGGGGGVGEAEGSAGFS